MTIIDLLIQVREIQSETAQEITVLEDERDRRVLELQGLVSRLQHRLETLEEIEEKLMGLVAVLASPPAPASGSSVATGTLLASTISQDAIVAGGKTIINTLTNATWAASGAAFDAERRGILDAIISDLSEANGWDVQKANLNVGDVVRTSDTVVTITLSALPNYVITTPEILTVVAPASATSDAGAIVAPEQATITHLYDLVASGTVTSSSNGQTIEKLDITADSATHAVNINHNNVTLRHCNISHAQSGMVGVKVASGVTGFVMEDCKVVHTGAPATGTLPSKQERNIWLVQTVSAVLSRIYTEDGSVGIYDEAGTGSITLTNHHSVNQRGPFSHGQAFQSNGGAGGLYTGFNIVNDRTVAWVEDNINLATTTGTWTISEGVIDGNNAQSGIGVMVESGTSTVLVEDVDAIRMGNGAFAASGQNNVTYNRCRARDNSNASYQGRGHPKSANLDGSGLPVTAGTPGYPTTAPNTYCRRRHSDGFE